MAGIPENYVLPWFGARSQFGDFEAAGQQCFRIFETKESFANLHALMTAEFARLKTLATELTKVWFKIFNYDVHNRKILGINFG